MSINERHEAFARAVVALAREHRMNHLALSFDESSSRNFSVDFSRHSGPMVHCTWSEGRHGDETNIIMRSESHETAAGN